MSAALTAAKVRLRAAMKALGRPNREPEWYQACEARVAKREADVADLERLEEARRFKNPIAGDLSSAQTANDAVRELVARETSPEVRALVTARSPRGARGARAVDIVMTTGRFYDPTTALQEAIDASLRPNEGGSGRWVPKKRERRIRTLPFLANGKLQTHRFRGWTPLTVAQAGDEGREFLAWILEKADADLLPPRDRRVLLMALAATGGTKVRARARLPREER